jgi:hypothetical protein
MDSTLRWINKKIQWPLPIPLREPTISCPNNIKKKMEMYSKNKDNLQLFKGYGIIEAMFYMYLFKRYNSSCYIIDSKNYAVGLTLNKRIDNEEQYNFYDYVAYRLKNCIKKGSNIVIIPLTILFNGTGHMNILVYRKANNVIEHFEPHGRTLMIRNKEVKGFLKKSLNSFMENLNDYFKKANLDQVTFIPSKEVFPYYIGLQTLESALPYNDKNVKGYCAAWSALFAELVLTNPHLSSREIVEGVYVTAGKGYGGQNLKDIIEGYANHINEKVNKYYSIIFDKPMNCALVHSWTKGKWVDNYQRILKIVDVEMNLLENNITVQQRIEELENIKITTENENDIKDELAILRKLETQEQMTPKSASPNLTQPSYTKKGKNTPPSHTKKGGNTPPSKKENTSTTKKKRCPNGTRRNPVTGACEEIKQSPEMTTRIEVKEYNGRKLEVTYTINQQISGSKMITVNKNFGERHNDDQDFYTEIEFMDELTLKGVVIGLTNKIHIFSLAPADKELFENLKELPMCIDFKVEPGVNLTNIPKINDAEYKKEECPICHEQLYTTEHGGPVVGIGFKGCGHKFHRECLTTSLKYKNNCPLCRRKITDFMSIQIDRAEKESGGTRRNKTAKKKKRSKSV